jgi:DNA invertase Pin-like site-specific DNA recombinase
MFIEYSAFLITLKLKDESPNMPRISKKELLKLQKTVGPDTSIAKLYSISRQAVHQMRKIYGIPALTIKNAERNEKIVEAYRNGALQLDIAKAFNISDGTVYRVIKAAGAGKNLNSNQNKINNCP